MSQYIMNIDSTYRDQKQYPLSTEFGVIVNSKPGQFSSGNIFIVENVIYSRFTWNGTTTTTVPNDTIEGDFVDFTSRVVTLDPAHASGALNYYAGCVFYLDSGVSSVIIFYDPDLNTVTLSNPIPLTYYDPSNTKYKIVNPSYNYLNDLLLLGNNRFVNLSNDNVNSLYFLKSGPTNTLFVQNATAGWVLPIDKVLPGAVRMVSFATNMPSYINGDLFQVRASSRIMNYTSTAAATPASIRTLFVSVRGSGYSVGEVVTIQYSGATTPATYLITRVDSDGEILDLVVQDPGAGYIIGLFSIRNPGGNITARGVVEAVSWSVPLTPLPPEGSFLIYVPTIEPFLRSMFIVEEITGTRVFFSNPLETPIPDDTLVELLPYKTLSTGLNMPLVAHNQAVCYDVSLIHLILPNQPVRGFNVLPTFFPYLMIELYNTSMSGSNAGIIYSNNPNTERVTFYCPIGNPKNPVIVSYLVIVSSTQVQTIKWAPTDNFFFRVILPNGETLRFNFDEDVNESTILSKNVLTDNQNFNFIGQTTDRRVSATFSFRLKRKP